MLLFAYLVLFLAACFALTYRRAAQHRRMYQRVPVGKADQIRIRRH